MDDQLLEKVKAHLSGDPEVDVSYAYECVRGHFDQLRDDPEFLERLVTVLGDQYPDRREMISDLWHDIIDRSDEKFIDKMFRLVDQDEATRAQFEMNFFISAMEEEFKQYKPTMNVRDLSIYRPVDLFEFNFHEPLETELRQTPRDYSGIYISYARVLQAANEWQEATEAYQQALLWNPYNVIAMLDLAHLYLHLNQFGMCYATALNALKHALRPTDLARAYYYIARFYQKKGDQETAMKILRISEYWEPHGKTTDRLKKFAEEYTLPPEVISREQIEEILSQCHLGYYPDSHHLNGLKAFASRLKVVGDVNGALKLYRYYQELVRTEDEAVDQIMKSLEKQVN